MFNNFIKFFRMKKIINLRNVAIMIACLAASSVFAKGGTIESTSIAGDDTYEIIVVASPPEGGEVFGSGIYLYGDEVTITATPSECFVFVCWTEEDGMIVSIDQFYSFVVTQDLVLVANFEIKTFEIFLLADPEEGGEVFGGGTFACGEEITIEAIPAADYYFLHWITKGMIVSTMPIYTIVVTEDRTYTAVFAGEGGKFKITLLSNPAEGGVVFGEGYYDYGETVTISATSNPEYDFINWLEEGVELLTDSEYTFTVTSSRTLTGNFETYDIVILSNTPDCGVSGGGNYRPGIEVTVSANTRGNSYEFVNWTKNGTVVSTDAEYTFITAIGDMELVANFVETVGIEQLQVTSYELQVYPNPTSGELIIENGELIIENVEIFDILGKKQKIIFNFQLSTFNLTDLPVGIYFIRIQTEEGVITRRIVKD